MEVTIKETDYFIDSAPQELTYKTEKFTNKVNVFYKKNLHSYMDINDAVDLLDFQPTENTVRNAIIWSRGIKGEKPDYIIKSGGGSISDNEFVSQLWCIVPDPQNQKDKRVLVLTKCSNNFNDVLIHESEIRKLWNLTKTSEQGKEEAENDILMHINVLLGAHVTINGKEVQLSKGNKEYDDILDRLAREYNKGRIIKHIDRRIELFEKRKGREFAENIDKLLDIKNEIIREY